jgi:hypothetical protein
MAYKYDELGRSNSNPQLCQVLVPFSSFQGYGWVQQIPIPRWLQMYMFLSKISLMIWK